MDIRDIDGMWCDDITFCQEECGWMSCPRNKRNIRDKTVPHSFSVEIPEDCPKKEGRAVKMKHNVPIQSLIDHIKTAVDVDPWAKEMVEELLKERPEIVRCKDCKHRPKEIPFTTTWGGHDTYLEFPEGSRCPCQCSGDEYYSWNPDDDWFCADGEAMT